MQNIIGTGLSGLVGSRVVELLSSLYQFENLSRKTGVDITDKGQVIQKISASSAPVVFHFAAKTDVDESEREKDLGEQSEAWKINVEGTRNVVQACEQTGKKIIYISTDMVFDGEKPFGEKYAEEDVPNPRNWYAKTKYTGEQVVQGAKIPWIILRIAYPYRASFEKKEYVRVFLSLLQTNREISAVADHYFTPTFIDDMAQVLDVCIKQNVTGIFHTVGGQMISPYDAACIVAQTFQLNQELINKTTREIYFAGKATRPFNSALKSDKIRKLGMRMKNFERGVEEIKKQIV